MRYAIISDIHSNLEAFTAVLARIRELAPDRVLCLGDVVGYGADPNACVEILRQEKITCIIGNHDVRAVGMKEPTDFNAAAARAVLWTREQLEDDNRTFLRGLQPEARIDEFFIFHGSVHDTDRYILTNRDLKDNFQLLNELDEAPRLGFFGHTHLRAAFTRSRGSITALRDDRFVLEGTGTYLINPGSVGQPRDQDPRASFLVYDTNDGMVSFFRVEYDIPACQDKIIRAGLPPRLAERLAGGW